MTTKLLPHKQHFIHADKCEFSIAHFVNNQYIVSTVGEYFPQAGCGQDNIRGNKKYETIVFKARSSKKECKVCECEIIDYEELDVLLCNTARQAYKNHFKLIEKYEHKT